MRLPISLLTCFSILLLASCSGSGYSEEERETYLEAEQAHYETIRVFGEAFDNLNILTSLQDSIDTRISLVDNYLSVEGVDTDSLGQVKNSLSAAREELTSAKNELLIWSDAIYGLPDDTSPYKDSEDNEPPSIAKDEQNDMITNNISYKPLPADVTPEELLKIQEEQLKSITTIHQQIEASIQKAEEAIAENL